VKMSKICGAVVGKSGGAGVLSKKISNTGVVQSSAIQSAPCINDHVSAVVSGGKSFSA